MAKSPYIRMQCAWNIYCDITIEQHMNAIKMLRKMKLLGTPMAIQTIPMATQKNEPNAQLLDDD